MEEKLVINSAIWDLHIHTCLCEKSTGSFKCLDVNGYIDLLISIFNDYKNLKMISFTDHNKINYEVYEEFYSRKTDIRLIPGIEIDCYVDSSETTKHILLYFNIEENDLENFANNLNSFLSKEHMPVKLDNLLTYLLETGIEFVLSPHAFKQRSKGIEYDWVEECQAKNNAKQFMDQFFCFWEASGKSEIANAIQFLNDFELNNKISIVSFSDSSDETKLRNYLDSPNQYFNSLPNFKGLQLAGTDVGRITKTAYYSSNKASGDYIYKVIFEGEEIYFSARLNAIIGGRGSGKSLLLDNIAINLNDKIKDGDYLKKERISFLDQFEIKIFNSAENELKSGSMNIDYFNQLYVSKIFDSNDSDRLLLGYFSDEFEKIEEINHEGIHADLKKKFNTFIKEYTSNKVNVSSLINDFVKIENDDVIFSFNKSDIPNQDQIEYIKNNIAEILSEANILPIQLSDNKDIQQKIWELYSEINNAIHAYNLSDILKTGSKYFMESCIEYNNSKSKVENAKKSAEDNFVNKIQNTEIKFLQRADIITALINISNYTDWRLSNFITIDGYNDNKFKFAKEVVIEHPFNYFFRITNEYLDNKKIGILNNKELIYLFLSDVEKYIKDSKTYEDYILKLLKLDLNISYENKIYYKSKDEDFIDLFKMSPGTQTNILMEYIVNKDTSIPLLIDQPEDNIDNKTIYETIISWFNNLKIKRQILVVTHDANIVINADAENLIISDKKEGNKFTYSYGSLECDDNINSASIILDGGIEAVERRLKKYGE